MRIVLRGDVEGLGRKGDVVDVADGYARNYLVPKGLALRSTAGGEREAADMARSREIKDAKDLTTAQELATRFNGVVLTIPARAGEGGKLFGSVSSSDVADAAKAQANAEVDRRVIELEEAIKTIGTHRVPVRPHPDVLFEMTVEVIPED